jgi:acyl carrier protein
MEYNMEIKEQIKQFFEDNFMAEFEDGFNDASSFLEHGIIDSTGVLELVSFLEENFEIKIEDNELIPENLDSFSSIENFINTKI